VLTLGVLAVVTHARRLPLRQAVRALVGATLLASSLFHLLWGENTLADFAAEPPARRAFLALVGSREVTVPLLALACVAAAGPDAWGTLYALGVTGLAAAGASFPAGCALPVFSATPASLVQDVGGMVLGLRWIVWR
jgi:hypothetical protein